MSTADPFEQADAAYVFGAMDPAEAAQFETHLATCAACAQRVAQTRQLVSMFDGITPEEIEAVAPETLLPGLLRKASVARRRQRWLVSGLAAVAAACLVSLVVLAWPASSTHSGHSLAMTALAPSPVSATVSLTDKSTGTQIELHCSYAYGSSDHAVEYGLVVYDRSGHHYSLSSWRLGPGEDSTFPATTALHENQISHLDVTVAP
jgi:predicted anti-sigma-YlaC factor YlaD